LRGGELSRVEAHLTECEGCELRIDDVRSIRSTLRKLPQAQTPADLRTRLRVGASRERSALFEANGSRWQRVWKNWKFRFHEMMRPLTIPATGGVLSSLLLFGALTFTIGTTSRVVAYEVPVVYSDHVAANLVPLDLHSAVVLTLSLDGNGRITDYAVRDGGNSFVGNAARLQDNNITMPEIPSVLAMALPISSDIRISFKPMMFRQ
jgi:hypothetical protein